MANLLALLGKLLIDILDGGVFVNFDKIVRAHGLQERTIHILVR